MTALANVTGQLPHAMRLGLNRLANLGQKAEQAQMRKGFHLRREPFVIRGIKILKADRATKTSWSVLIQLAYPDNRHFMDLHESGGSRVRHGGRYLWQPNQEVFKSKVISAANALHPSNLHMHRTPGGQIKGDNGTFMVKTLSGWRGVIQRITKGKKGKAQKKTTNTRTLYRLVARVRIPADLKFVQTISREVNAQQARVMDQALREAMMTARI